MACIVILFCIIGIIIKNYFRKKRLKYPNNNTRFRTFNSDKKKFIFIFAQLNNNYNKSIVMNLSRVIQQEHNNYRNEIF